MSDSCGVEQLPTAVLLAPLPNGFFVSVEEVSVANRRHYAEDTVIEMIVNLRPSGAHETQGIESKEVAHFKLADQY